jgi:UDP:flavonoid glycosyltransferase YjiC (YdhE family)
MQILFSIEHQYGHINPSLGTAMELVKRGHDVSYTTSEAFAPIIRSIGASPIVLDCLENRLQAIPNLFKENDHRSFQTDPEKLATFMESFRTRTAHSLLQLERLYGEQARPDFMVRDDVLDEGGREFALRFAIPNALLISQFLHWNLSDVYQNEKLILVTVPEFFQKIPADGVVPPRYNFVGFTPEGRTLGFEPWTPLSGYRPRVLISPTTGLLKQIDFCRRMLDAFRDQPWDVILSLSASRDAFSAIDPTLLDACPPNVRINQRSANFDILRSVCLYVGQGGQGGVLEAIYRGVPQIVVPASALHYKVGRRVDELGLGACIPFSELSGDGLIERAGRLLEDRNTLDRIAAARNSMETSRSAERAADAIEQSMEQHTSW